MPIVKYDVTDLDAEESAGKADFNKPKPGVYNARVKSIILEKPAGMDQRIVAEFEITDGEFKGWPRKVYINTESTAAKWKYDQFMLAFGISKTKRKGQFNTDTLQGKACKIRVKSGWWTPEGETEKQYSPEIGAILSKDSDDEVGSDAHGDVGDGGDGGDTHGDVDESAADDDGWTKFLGMDEEQLAALEDEIRPYCVEVGVDPDTVATWVEVIEQVNDLRNAGDAAEPEPTEPETEPEPGADDDEYDDPEVWPLAELKGEAKRRTLDQKGTRDAIVARLRESDKTGPFGA